MPARIPGVSSCADAGVWQVADGSNEFRIALSLLPVKRRLASGVWRGPRHNYLCYIVFIAAVLRGSGLAAPDHKGNSWRTRADSFAASFW